MEAPDGYTTFEPQGPASPGDWIEGRARVERVGGTVSFADVSLTVEDREIVRARAVFVVAG